MSPLRAVTHWPGHSPGRLSNLGPPSTFSITLVGVREDASGLEVFTCVHSGGAVTDVPIMPGEGAGSDTYYGILRAKPGREWTVGEIAKYLTAARCNDWTAPIGNEVLALIDALACKTGAGR